MQTNRDRNFAQKLPTKFSDIFRPLLLYYLLCSAVIYLLSPSKSGTPLIANFLITSVLGLWAFWYFWSRAPSLSLENLENMRLDTHGRHIILYCAAYMLADLPMLYFDGVTRGDCIMYTIHHVFSFITLVSVLLIAKYEWFVMCMVTCEISNFFFNGQYLLADLGYHQYAMPMQLGFVAVFFGYRIGFLLPWNLRLLVSVLKKRRYFDFFVVLIGPIIAIPLHMYWSYLLVVAIFALF